MTKTLLAISLTILTGLFSFGNSANYLKLYNWSFQNQWYSISLDLSQSDYDYYRSLSKKQDYVNYVKEDSLHPYLGNIAYQLKMLANRNGYYELGEIKFITTFVQHITYDRDPVNLGYDYNKYPIETLVEQKGDCEDSAYLLAALLKTLSYDCILINPTGHMAVGIAHPQLFGSHYLHKGKKFFYVEQTQPNWEIGIIPSMYANASVRLFDIEQTASIDKYKDLQLIYTSKEDAYLVPVQSIYEGGTTGQEDIYDSFYYDSDDQSYKSPDQTKTVYYQTTTPINTTYVNTCYCPTGYYLQNVYYQNPKVNVQVNLNTSYGIFNFNVIR